MEEIHRLRIMKCDFKKLKKSCIVFHLWHCLWYEHPSIIWFDVITSNHFEGVSFWALISSNQFVMLLSFTLILKVFMDTFKLRCIPKGYSKILLICFWCSLPKPYLVFFIWTWKSFSAVCMCSAAAFHLDPTQGPARPIPSKTSLHPTLKLPVLPAGKTLSSLLIWCVSSRVLQLQVDLFVSPERFLRNVTVANPDACSRNSYWTAK